MEMNQNVVVNGGGAGSRADVWSRGTKRGASDSNLQDLERFEKRLRMLSIRMLPFTAIDRDLKG